MSPQAWRSTVIALVAVFYAGIALVVFYGGMALLVTLLEWLLL